jgi:Protein of unknown function (DUF3500)
VKGALLLFRGRGTATARLRGAADTGCGSDSTSSTAASATASGQPGGSAAPGGAGGPGGQQIAGVNLNTDGASPGGANTAAVVTAVNAFLATLENTKRDTVEYDFTDNQARQTWSNFPATAVPREGIALSDLSTDQQKAALAVVQVALSGEGYQQSTDIQKADDYLNSLGGQGADGFGGLKYESELDQTRIGWSNNTGPTDEHSYFRIDGPSVWIEFINTRSMSTPDIHCHSVYRDKTNDYGSSKPS